MLLDIMLAPIVNKNEMISFFCHLKKNYFQFPIISRFSANPGPRTLLFLQGIRQAHGSTALAWLPKTDMLAGTESSAFKTNQEDGKTTAEEIVWVSSYQLN